MFLQGEHGSDFYFCCKYTKWQVLKMIKLELFLVLFPVGYLDTILFLETDKVQNLPYTLVSS